MMVPSVHGGLPGKAGMMGEDDCSPVVSRGAKPELASLSRSARSLWGKSDYGVQRQWLPLFVHMSDSAFVAQHLWDEWLPASTKRAVSVPFGSRDSARAFFSFVAGVHDIGKATPAFQSQPCGWAGGEVSLTWLPERVGLPFPPESRERGVPNHAVMGQALLEKMIRDADGETGDADGRSTSNVHAREAVRTISSLVGCHHGKPSTRKGVHDALEVHRVAVGISKPEWCDVQRELLNFAFRLSAFSMDGLFAVCAERLAPQTASLLSGMLTMCDWIASDTDCFPLVSLPYVEDTGYGADGCVETWTDEFLQVDDPALSIDTLRERGRRGWRSVQMVPSWQASPVDGAIAEHLFERRFGFPDGAVPRPVQREALEAALSIDEPGIMVIEAPMGEGKTEAALAVAEVFAAKTGAGGVCLALPTMATTDAMFGRVHRWLERLPHDKGGDARSVCLAHGKARLNEEYQGITRQRPSGWGLYGEDAIEGVLAEDTVGQGVIVSDWMSGRRRGMLSNFVVCTVDQVLMGALQMKHLALRQLALANKVVIIDECHAYDMYMRQYLEVILNWLGSWRVPVILLSATLPAKQRTDMLRAYIQGRKAKRADRRRSLRRRAPLTQDKVPDFKETVALDGETYPLLTYSDGNSLEYRPTDSASHPFSAELCIIDDELDSLLAVIEDLTVEGGCVGVICDTVARAQAASEILASRFGDGSVTLCHARFMDIDRMENEKGLREMLGPDATLENGGRPRFHIVVGTQVLEQSLDIDFDVLVTDVAPVDLLLQRMGRCHRHEGRTRPARLAKPKCYVRGIEGWDGEGPCFVKDLARVYDRASLIESLSVCRLIEEGATSRLMLPNDIATLVRLAYSEQVDRAVPNRWRERYGRACAEREKEQKRKRERAHCCLLRPAEEMIREGLSLTDWYQLSTTDKTDGDYGPRAVRDTQETVEVMLLGRNENRIHLLPWIGDPGRGIEFGAEIPTEIVPDRDISMLAIQSCVRLPLTLCGMDRIGALIGALEEIDGPSMGSWQDSPWIAGELALFMEEKGGMFETTLDLGPSGGAWKVAYARSSGLTACRVKY